MAMINAPSSLPSGTRHLLPCSETPWRLSDTVFGRLQLQPGVTYKVTQLTSKDPEWDFVLAYFNHQKPTNLAIKAIHVIHGARVQGSFESNIGTTELEAKKFFPKWEQEGHLVAQKKEVHARWEVLKKEFSPFSIQWGAGKVDHYLKTAILPVWHGTTQAKARSICETSLTSFGKHFYWDKTGSGVNTDHGYFGSGVYVTTSARYAADIYSDGTLLMLWASMRQPYPVVAEVDGSCPNKKPIDVTKLEAKELYKDYNAHYIPVRSISPADPQCHVYYPCGPTESPSVDELVLKSGVQTLPRFWVELQTDLPLQLTIASPAIPGINLEGICEKEKKEVIIPIGKGSYDLGTLVFEAKCPSCKSGVDAKQLIFTNCTYSLDGKKQDKTPLKISDSFVDELKINLSELIKADIKAM